ncbi:MAG: hypothetical protein CL528_00420 [Aequorivita sp.]|jgi:hypothetical protein|nr:hypothetical protein [Aequorivita sp.]MBP40214.1 hypothetical protein [Aequorivita sp.]|tara:strand:- start:3439 stop:3690 length:252 start_codon:yes stop_codon:yes gene_type:complete
MSQATELKPIPNTPSKSEVYEMYRKTPKATVRRAIQDAVNIVNDQSRIKFSKNVKTLNSKHMKLIVEELGTAEGYEELKSEGV